MFFSAISIKAYRCGLKLFISVETLHFQGTSRYCYKNQSANTDGGTPARDALKEIRKKRSVGHFKLTAMLKGTKKVNKNVYSLPLHVCTRPFHIWTLSHDSRQMKQIQRYDYLVPRSLVDERSGYEINSTTVTMTRAVQNPYQTVVERQIKHQKSRRLLSATIIS